MKKILNYIWTAILALLVLTACSSKPNVTNHQQRLSQSLQDNKQDIYYIFKRDDTSPFQYDHNDTPDSIVIKKNGYYETYWLASMEQPPKGFTLKALSKLSDKDIIHKLKQLDVVSVDQAISEITASDDRYASKPAKEFGVGFKLLIHSEKGSKKTQSETVEVLSTATNERFTTLNQLDQSKTFTFSKSTYNGLAKTNENGDTLEGIFRRSKKKVVLDQPASHDNFQIDITLSEKDIQKIAQLNQKIDEKMSTNDSSSQSKEQSTEVYQESSARTPWDAAKNKKLADFMVSWGQSMGQYPYKDITSDVARANITFDGQTLADITYSENGISNAEYTLVASYEHWYSDMQLHRYLFVIRKDGTPQVLYSLNNQGFSANGIDFVYYIAKETENTDLKKGFADIVN
ncbi:DUF4767 domain-containing protein [Streptococcus halotolerans]|uniref:DUF4767 domain-containing protein n=1 Tax=Streptococcus halotolerans TaxID=1814128 RepID=UPI000789981E|nr:DUF4767 domain-containing protein [Streptococcus halotolerans]